MSDQRSREFYTLVRKIGETRCKADEDQIIGREITTLKNHIKTGKKLKPHQLKELVIRLLYCEILGHETQFGHIEAINLTSVKNAKFRRVGYLCVTLMMDRSDEKMLLVVANIQKDLSSPNHLQVNSALSIATKIMTSELIPSLLSLTLPLVDHTFPLIRKKAIALLNCMVKLDPGCIDDIYAICKKGLSDAHPSVMSASLSLFSNLIDLHNQNLLEESNEEQILNVSDEKVEEKEDLKSLSKYIIEVFNQILDHRLPIDYMYHRISAPWVQIKILKIFQKLGRDDPEVSAQFHGVLIKCLKRNDIGLVIGYSVIYECVKSICKIYFDKVLFSSALQSIGRLIGVENNHNLRYVGMKCLNKILKIQPAYSVRFQGHVIDCLDSNDASLRGITLELLYKMTTSENLEVICDKLLEYFKKSILIEEKKKMMEKIVVLAETYSPNYAVFFEILNMLFRCDPTLVPENILNSVTTIVKQENPEDEILAIIDSFLTLLTSSEYKEMDVKYLKIVAWFFSKYYKLLKSHSREESVLNVFIDVFQKNHKPAEMTSQAMIVFFFSKIVSGLLVGDNEESQILSLLERFEHSKNITTQQVFNELRVLLSKEADGGRGAILKSVFSGAQHVDMIYDVELSFLDDYVDDCLRRGYQDYDHDLDVYDESFKLHEIKQLMLEHKRNEKAVAPDPYSSLLDDNEENGENEREEENKPVEITDFSHLVRSSESVWGEDEDEGEENIKENIEENIEDTGEESDSQEPRKNFDKFGIGSSDLRNFSRMHSSSNNDYVPPRQIIEKEKKRVKKKTKKFVSKMFGSPTTTTTSPRGNYNQSSQNSPVIGQPQVTQQPPLIEEEPNEVEVQNQAEQQASLESFFTSTAPTTTKKSNQTVDQLLQF